jgi:membrane protein
MFAILLSALGILYRFGPSRRRRDGNGSASARWPRLLWIAGSSLLSWYLSNFGNYNATYGSLGAAIGLMMWMWMSAIIVLCGAELNAEIEHQTARDSNGRAAQTARCPRRRDGGHAGTGSSVTP